MKYNNKMQQKRPLFIVNVEAAIYREGKYLLIKRSSEEEHSPGTLSLPGGKVELNAVSPDALETALRREIYEEVGLELNDLFYIESKAFTMDTGEMCLGICFFCQKFQGKALAKSLHEVESVAWLTQSEIIKDTNTPAWTLQSITASEKFLLHNGELFN